MTDKVHKEKYITPIGTSFMEYIVPHLIKEALSLRRISEKNFGFINLNRFKSSRQIRRLYGNRDNCPSGDYSWLLSLGQVSAITKMERAK